MQADILTGDPQSQYTDIFRNSAQPPGHPMGVY